MTEWHTGSIVENHGLSGNEKSDQSQILPQRQNKKEDIVMKPRPMSLLYVGVMFLFMLLSPQIGLSEDEPDLGYQNFFIAGSPDPKNTLIETNKDYYSVYLFSVFLDKDESFFKKNNLAVLVNLEVDPKSRYRIT